MTQGLVLPDGSVLDVEDVSKVSDGFHTFEELYHHRCHLFMLVISVFRRQAWWSRYHQDGSMFPGFIIVSIDLPGAGAVTYHVEDWYAPVLAGLGVRELPVAPAWDGAGSQQTLERIEDYVNRVSVPRCPKCGAQGTPLGAAGFPDNETGFDCPQCGTWSVSLQGWGNGMGTKEDLDAFRRLGGD